MYTSFKTYFILHSIRERCVQLDSICSEHFFTLEPKTSIYLDFREYAKTEYHIYVKRKGETNGSQAVFQIKLQKLLIKFEFSIPLNALQNFFFIHLLPHAFWGMTGPFDNMKMLLSKPFFWSSGIMLSLVPCPC